MISMPRLHARRGTMLAVAAALVLAGCARDNEIDLTNGVGITASRNLCPAVGVPAHTGDVTIFDPPTSRDARAIDVVATITNLRTSCSEDAGPLYAGTTFDVIATRRDAGAARDVTLPYYSAVVQGNTNVVAKDIGNVTVRFAEGQTRATAQATAGAYVNREATVLPPDIEQRITRRRRAGEADAALDPMADPEVRAAVARATFELLIGFQLNQEQLQYNVTR